MAVLNDVYASRHSDVAELVERADPVVHTGEGDVADGPLDSERLQQYEREGFLFFENFFDPQTVDVLRTELDQLRDRPDIRSADETITEPVSGEVRSIFAVHRLNAVFEALSRDQRVLNMARQILGSEVYIHQSRINIKPGFHGKEFYWHSDFETWHIEDGMPRMRALSCSLLLTDNCEFNGPLMVVPGSHHSFVVCVGKTPENHYKQSLKKQEYGVPSEEMLAELVGRRGITAPKGPAGSLLLFDCNTMHGSSSNISPWPRSNVFMVYNSVENTPAAPYSGQKPRPNFIAEREDFTPLKPHQPDYLALRRDIT